MRWASAGVMVLIGGLVASSQDEAPNWVKYSSQDPSVAILFPGKPGVKKTKGGQEILLETDKGKTAYMLRFDPFPKAIKLSDTELIDRVFDGVKNGLEKSGGMIKKERSFQVNKKYPAVEFDAVSKGIPDHKIQVIVTEKWLIQVHAGGMHGTPKTEDALLFLNSFTLKE